MSSAPEGSHSTCVVVGGGPAGMMTGLLLARQGVQVTVLEKYPDFFRDFRGDTIHPSTLELMDQLGWLEELLDLPHVRMNQVTIRLGQRDLTVADFTRLPVPAPYIAFMPQWDFLNFLKNKGEELPTFVLRQQIAATGLSWDQGRVSGVTLRAADGSTSTLTADLVIGADGRHSTIRRAAGLEAVVSSPPMDVLWFRLPRSAGAEVPFFQGGRGALVSIDRGDYWQIAYAIPAGKAAELRSQGLAAFRAAVAAIQPAFGSALAGIDDWDQVLELQVRVDRLRQWSKPGLLCIGDAAHAMSPAGGVGVNLAIQDAVATSNSLGRALSQGEPVDHLLPQIQRRRELPIRLTQRFQVAVLRDLYPKSLADDTSQHPPVVLRAIAAVPILRHALGRFIGLGVRRERIRNPAQLTVCR